MIPNYLPICIPAYKPACLSSFPPACLPANLSEYANRLTWQSPSLSVFCQSANLPLNLSTCLPAYLPTCQTEFKPFILPFYQPANMPANMPANLLTNLAIYLRTFLPTTYLPTTCLPPYLPLSPHAQLPTCFYLPITCRSIFWYFPGGWVGYLGI